MILRKKGDYKVIVENRDTPNESEWLIVKSEHLSDIIQRVNNGEFTRLSFSKTNGYLLDNADFLKECQGVKGLSFGDVDVNSAFDIYHFQELDSFSASFKLGFDIDFSRFPALISLGLNFSKYARNIGRCEKIETLSLTNYSSVSRDLSEFSKLSKIKDLRLFKSNIESVHGIEGMTSLNDLMLCSLPKLTNINDLKCLATSLSEIDFESCKSINSYDCFNFLVNVQKVIIDKCAPIQNLQFITRMMKLKHFAFMDTDVTDGNLAWLVESKIESVGFTDKKHFSHKYKFFEARNKPQY
jgi:hypothetical protein